MSHKKGTIPLLLILFLTFLICFPVSGISYVMLTTGSNVQTLFIDQQIAKANNGDLYYGWIQTVVPYFRVNVYGPTGTLKAELNVVPSHLPPTQYLNRCDMVLQNYNTTHILLIVGTVGAASTYTTCYYIQISSFAITATNEVTLSSASVYFALIRLSSYITYSGKQYYVLVGSAATGTGGQGKSGFSVIELSGIVLTQRATQNILSGDLTDYKGCQTMLIHDELNPKNIVFGFTLGNTETQPRYWHCALDTFVLTNLCLHPVTNQIKNEPRQKFLGGKIIYNGTLIYAYFTWIYPYADGSNYLHVLFVQHRLVFNVSISVPTLLSQNTRIRDWQTSIPTLPTGQLPFALGLMFEKDSIRSWFMNYYEGNYILEKVDFVIPDWFNYGITDDWQNPSGVTTYPKSNNQVPFIDEREIIGKIYDSNYQVNFIMPINYIYYDLSPIQENWDITLSHYPDDSSIYALKSYQWTSNTFLNGIGKNCSMIISVDNSIYKTIITSSNGQYQWTAVMFSSSGYHEINFRVYVLGEYKYNETFPFIVLESEAPETPTQEWLMPLYLTAIYNTLPIFLLILVPSVVLGEKLGLIGFIAGATIGVIAIVMWQPSLMYILYLFGLIIILAVVFLSRKGGE